ncbi:hypothetical protein [Chondromyces apiculatus]|uniref:Uncharacterized protein n=1 Tax=Chondromyces apiculatus DSM 436 TaxID=1192034 RepID=A0A017TCW6_9BACT|nr:hypothetical protein [Chondromyces apiculatus]EYF06471.1 Hypothetical protein CAP_2001 [Chondromyces apiculatus DSM 436]
MAEAPKRRLPIVGSEVQGRGRGGERGGGEPPEDAGAGGARGGEGEGEARPAWQWAVFGMVATFGAWMPLAVGTQALLQQVVLGVAGGEVPAGTQAAMVGLNALAFGVAAAAGGALVGRFGAPAGLREASAGGALAGGLAWALALTQGAGAGVLVWAILLVVMASLGGGAGRLGGWLGRRWRR